jgi:hypothetical protein
MSWGCWASKRPMWVTIAIDVIFWLILGALAYGLFFCAKHIGIFKLVYLYNLC